MYDLTTHSASPYGGSHDEGHKTTSSYFVQNHIWSHALYIEKCAASIDHASPLHAFLYHSFVRISIFN